VKGRLKPPPNLRAETKRWWAEVAESYFLESHHLRLLTLACEAWDSRSAALEELKANGPYYLDRHGIKRANPALGVERDARISFARMLRELGLDIEPPADRRPPRLGGR
jgi:P27 family predicted phage terminase small subunit